MNKTIKITPEDYFKIKEYSRLKPLPIIEIIHRALKLYFADKKLKG
jgi:hypothetical protein